MPETENAGSIKRAEASDNRFSPLIQLASVIPTEENQNEIPALRASFAYELRSVRRQHDASRVIFGWAALLNNLRNAEEVAWSRNGLDIRQWLRVRLSGSAGRAAVTIIGQTEGGDEQGVREAALSLAAVLGDSLRGIAYAYRFEPCMDHEAQPAWAAVQGASQAMAVIRRESTITVADKPVYLRHDVFRASNGSDLLGLLSGCAADTAVDICIAPTRITPEERAAASESVNVWTDGLSKMLDSDPVDRMMQSQRLADEAGGARSRLANFLEQSHDGLFEVRVQVLSAGSADLLPLANRVGIALFGPMKHEVVTLPVSHADGANVMEMPRRARWAPSTAGPALRRMRDIFTAAEAIYVTCPPIPDGNGLTGFRLDVGKHAPYSGIHASTGVVVGSAMSWDRSASVPVVLPDSLRARHSYFAGRTGAGKSTLLVNMALQDMEAGRGVAFIDPHGEAIADLLLRIPPDRVEDVIYFNMTDDKQPIGFNIMGATDPLEQDLVIREFMGLMYRLFDPNRVGMIGPRWEQAVSTAMHAAFCLKDPTLNEVLRIISDLDYAKEVFQFVTDPVARQIFERVIMRMSDYHRSEILDYITSKFVRFVMDERVRNVISQTHYTLDVRRVMRDRKILLVNLAKGVIGPETAQFIGLLLLPQILIAALGRASLPPEQRELFCLYIDEFHTFETQALASALAEGRKYGLSLTLANQYTSQIAPSTLNAIMGNVGTIGSFRVGVNDAPLIAQEMAPVFTPDDLINLPNFQLAMKLADGDDASIPFLTRTAPLGRAADPAVASEIITRSRLIYGVDAARIKLQVDERYKSAPVARDPSAALRINASPKTSSGGYASRVGQFKVPLPAPVPDPPARQAADDQHEKTPLEVLEEILAAADEDRNSAQDD
jgi:hypothetical protein